ncbi:MAG: GNAT family N-acetyltransferase [Elusimicrobia bacterium]|nr:GNAT family N-acetyltransferase [Elusimicrobiota bacterium]
MTTTRLARSGIAVITAAALILQSSPLSANTIAAVRQAGSGVRSAVLPASGLGSRTFSFPTSLPLTIQTAPLVAPVAGAPLLLNSGAAAPEIPAGLLPSAPESPLLGPRDATAAEVLRSAFPLPADHGILKPGTPARTEEPSSESASSVEDRVWRHALERGFEKVSRGIDAVPEGVDEAPAQRLAPSSEHESGRPAAAPGIDAVRPDSGPAGTGSTKVRRTFLGVLGSVVAAELWIETGAFIIPFIAQSISGSFLSTAVICAGSAAALALGSILGGPAVDRFGIRKVYVAGLVVRSAGAAVLGALFAAGSLSLPVLGVLFAADYLLTGANRVAEGSAATALYGINIKAVNKFGAWKQRAIEIVGVAGPFLIGQAIAFGGFGPALAVFGGILGLGAFIAAATVRPPPSARASGSAGLREALVELKGNPSLRWAAGIFGLSTAVSLWLYLMLGPAFSLTAAPTPQAAAGIMGWLTGLFCVGGFIGTWLSEKLTQRSQERQAGASGLADRASFIRSTRVWAAFSSLSLLGAWAFSLPGILPALLAIVPFGIAFGGTLVQSETLIKLESPARLRGAILGLAAAAGFAFAAAGFFPLGWLFDHFSVIANGAARPSAAAFHVLGGLATSLSAASWWLAGRAPAASAIPEGQLGRITTLADLSRQRPRNEIMAEIKAICLEKKWDRWLADIESGISQSRSELFLALDDASRVAGFMLVTDRYLEDRTGVEVTLAGPFYLAYIATRAEHPVKGAGKALFLSAVRFVRNAGSGEMLAHIKKDSAAWGFFQSMSRYAPIKSSVEDPAYVVGETWMRTVFGVPRMAEETP